MRGTLFSSLLHSSSKVSRLLPRLGLSVSASATAPKRVVSFEGSKTKSKVNKLNIGPADMRHFYTEYPLNRAQELRTDKPRLEAMFSDPSSIIIPSFGGRFLFKKEKTSDGSKVVVPVLLRSPTSLPLAPGAAHVFLGLDPASGTAVFTAEVSTGEGPWVPHGCEWGNARSEGPLMSDKDAALLATASGLHSWLSKNKFCGRCSGKLGPKLGGHGLECIGDESRRLSPCRNSIFPRLDPATITLVTCGDWLLLGRKAEWAMGRYSLLAGFVELGESFEQGVAREIKEESGVLMDPSTLRYHSSQPWPFPQSLMVGMEGEVVWRDPRAGAPEDDPLAELLGAAESDMRRAVVQQKMTINEVAAALIPDAVLPVPAPEEDELEDVRWFHRDFIRAALGPAGSSVAGAATQGAYFNVPGEYSLAGKAIREWIDRGRGADDAWDGDRYPEVQIDQGVFKYVLIRLTDPVTGKSKILCHGSTAASYHDNIYQRVRGSAVKFGLRADVLGGGRINHKPDSGSVTVYGYSMAFGPAPHEVAASLIARWYPFYDRKWISVNYEGY